jgi:hypothetical protein
VLVVGVNDKELVAGRKTPGVVRTPGFGAVRIGQARLTAVMMTGAVWTHSRPSAAVEAAYQAHDDLAATRLDFTDALRSTLTALLAGLLARPPH